MVALSLRMISRLPMKRSKLRSFAIGQRQLMKRIAEAMETPRHSELYWIHVASYGEYAVARPVIRWMKERGKCVLVTFFSPTGIDALKKARRDASSPDYVFYLPLDTRKNAKAFIDTVKPKAAVFVISEYWVGYLRVLRKRNIPTYTVSTLIHDDSYLLKWYSGFIREGLKAVTTFMTIDEETKRNLARMGFDNVKVTGDPLFDNAVAIAQLPYQNTVVERFCKTSEKVFIAGSISDKKDRELVCTLANRFRNVKFIVVPHEITEATLTDIVSHLDGPSRRYSECTEETSFDDVQVLIIDYMGDLAKLYRYGRWAYVGGGFTPYLHSVIEPLAYGLPVAFGPKIERKTAPLQMVNMGIGCIVKTNEDIVQWFETLMKHPEKEADIAQKAKDYITLCSKATQVVAETINNRQ